MFRNSGLRRLEVRCGAIVDSITVERTNVDDVNNDNNSTNKNVSVDVCRAVRFGGSGGDTVITRAFEGALGAYITRIDLRRGGVLDHLVLHFDDGSFLEAGGDGGDTVEEMECRVRAVSYLCYIAPLTHVAAHIRTAT